MVNATSRSLGLGEADRGRSLQRDAGSAGGGRSKSVSAGGDIGAGEASEMGAVAQKQAKAWSDNLRGGGGCPTKGGGSRRGERRENVVTWEEEVRHRSSSLNPVLGTSRAGSGDAGGAGDGTVPDIPERLGKDERIELLAQERGRGTGGGGVGKGVAMRERLVALLDARGSYPADRRVEIWLKLLQVPEDAAKLLALSYALTRSYRTVEREKTPLTPCALPANTCQVPAASTAAAALLSPGTLSPPHLPVSGPPRGPGGEGQVAGSGGDDERDGRAAGRNAEGACREDRIATAMTRWCKGMCVAEWMPVLVERLCKISPSDEAVLELAMACVLTWGDNWLDLWPSPPPRWCAAAEELLRKMDAPLFHYLAHELGLSVGEDVTWLLVSTFLSRCLPVAQWTHVMDHLLCNPPIMLLSAATAMLLMIRVSLLAATSLQNIAALLRTPNNGVLASSLLEIAERVHALAAHQRLRLRDDLPSDLSLSSAHEFGSMALDASVLDSLGKPQEQLEWQPVWRRALPALRALGSGRGVEYAPFHRYPARRVEDHLARRRRQEEDESWLRQSCRKDTALEELKREFVGNRVAERNALRADLRARLATQGEAEELVRGQCRELHARHVVSSQQRLDHAEALRMHASTEREMAVVETQGVVEMIARAC